MMIGLIAAIEQLAREARTEIRHELLRIGSRAAELAGWFYRDIVMPELANYWRDRAVEWAQAAGDFSMQGYALLKKSQAAWDERDAVRMLTLARAAQEGPWRLPAHILAEAAQQEARAYAMMSRPLDIIEQRLARARSLLSRYDPDSIDAEAGLSAHYDEALFNLQLAICYCEAGQSDRALRLYDAWLTPQTLSRRDYGYFLSLKGLAYAVGEEPDEAAGAGLLALALARETNSARTHQEVLRLAGRLRLWRDRDKVSELCRALLA
jgi:tetratricopeptide (TPR) repeat protein